MTPGKVLEQYGAAARLGADLRNNGNQPAEDPILTRSMPSLLSLYNDKSPKDLNRISSSISHIRLKNFDEVACIAPSARVRPSPTTTGIQQGW
jgi:hypothetical protein